MYSKNPYGVPYKKMVEGAKFYDVWRKEWVVLEEPYDESHKSYWLVKSCDIDDGFRPLSHLDDLAYDVENEND